MRMRIDESKNRIRIEIETEQSVSVVVNGIGIEVQGTGPENLGKFKADPKPKKIKRGIISPMQPDNSSNGHSRYVNPCKPDTLPSLLWEPMLDLKPHTTKELGSIIDRPYGRVKNFVDLLRKAIKQAGYPFVVENIRGSGVYQLMEKAAPLSESLERTREILASNGADSIEGYGDPIPPVAADPVEKLRAEGQRIKGRNGASMTEYEVRAARALHIRLHMAFPEIRDLFKVLANREFHPKTLEWCQDPDQYKHAPSTRPQWRRVKGMIGLDEASLLRDAWKAQEL